MGISQEAYRVQQEDLFKQYKNAEQANKKALYEQMTINFLRKQIEDHQLEIVPPGSENSDKMTVLNTSPVVSRKPKESTDDGITLISTPKITLENMDKFLTIKNSAGQPVDCKKLFKDNPQVLQKICDLINFGVKQQHEELAKKMGLDVTRLENGSNYDYVYKSKSALGLDEMDKRVDSIMNDVKGDPIAAMMQPISPTSPTSPTSPISPIPPVPMRQISGQPPTDINLSGEQDVNPKAKPS